MFGRDPILPHDIIIGLDHPPYLDYLNFQEEQTKFLRAAYKAVNKYQLEQAIKNKRHRYKDRLSPTFKPGDKILLFEGKLIRNMG